MRNPESLVWIPEERAYGHIVGAMGAYYTMIAFTKAGQEYEVLMENEEFEIIGDEYE